MKEIIVLATLAFAVAAGRCDHGDRSPLPLGYDGVRQPQLVEKLRRIPPFSFFARLLVFKRIEPAVRRNMKATIHRGSPRSATK